MKLLILASDAFVSVYYLYKVLEKYHKNVIEIVCSSRPLLAKRGRGLRRYFKQGGLRYFIARAIMRLTMNFCDRICSLLRIKRYYNIRRLAREFRIPLSYAVNYNSPEVVARLSEKKPDYLISCCVPQKLKVEVLNLARKKAINIHGAPLPKYGGIAPALWAMANNEKESGCTVHVLAEEMDEGDILVQELIPIKLQQSFYDLSLKTATIGQRILLEALMQLEEDKANPVKQDLAQKTYFSHPGPEQIRQARKNGHVLLRSRDLIQWIKAGPSL